MLGTVAALSVALIAIFTNVPVQMETLRIACLIFGIAVPAFAVWATASSYPALQRLESDVVPGAIRKLVEDQSLRICGGILALFPLVALFFATFSLNWNPAWVLAGFVLSLGISIDASIFLLLCLAKLLDPQSLLESNSSTSTRELIERLEFLGDVGERASLEGNAHLARHAVTEIVALFSKNSQKSEYEVILACTLERLDLIQRAAIAKRQQALLCHLISLYAALSEEVAKERLRNATHPLHHLGVSARSAMEKDMPEVAVKASLALVQLGGRIIQRIDPSKVSLQEFYISIVSHLEDIAKETFRKDKSISPDILAHPFREIRKLFEEDSLIDREDVQTILKAIQRILDDFAALSSIVQHLPVDSDENSTDRS